MHPYRGIVHTYRRSDGLSMRSGDPNALTWQYTVIRWPQGKPAVPPPVTWNATLTRIYSLRLHLRLCNQHLHRSHNWLERWRLVTTLSRDTSFSLWKIHHQHQQFCAGHHVPTRFYSMFPTWFNSPFLTRFDSVFIWFYSCLTYLFLIRVTLFEFNFNQASGSST